MDQKDGTTSSIRWLCKGGIWMPIILGVLAILFFLIILSINPWLFLIIPLVILGIIIFILVINTKMEKKKFKGKSPEDALKEAIVNLNVTMKYTEELSKNTIIYSEKDQCFYILTKKNGYFDKKVINFRDILQVEIIEDSESVTQTARASQLAGTLIGGLALGGAGAVIGGLSGKKNHHNEVNNIELQFVVNDANNPIRKYKFYHFLKAVKTNEDKYKNSYQTVYEWFKLVEVLIHQADKDDGKRVDN